MVTVSGYMCAVLAAFTHVRGTVWRQSPCASPASPTLEGDQCYQKSLLVQPVAQMWHIHVLFDSEVPAADNGTEAMKALATGLEAHFPDLHHTRGATQTQSMSEWPGPLIRGRRAPKRRLWPLSPGSQSILERSVPLFTLTQGVSRVTTACGVVS